MLLFAATAAELLVYGMALAHNSPPELRSIVPGTREKAMSVPERRGLWVLAIQRLGLGAWSSG